MSTSTGAGMSQQLSKYGSAATAAYNNVIQGKNTSPIIGGLAALFIIIIIIVVSISIANGKNTSYMNSFTVNPNFHSLYYPDPIKYDACGNIIYVDSSGNGNDGSYHINDYYIYGSYNSCNISGRNTNNYMNLNALKYIISQGVRFIDFEIYNINDQPVIATSSIPSNFFIKESYNSVTFQDAFKTIITNAFNNISAPNPDDPIFLHLRIKSTNHTMMDNIAQIFLENEFYMLDPMYSHEYQICNENNCTPRNLSQLPLYIFKKKIIVMVDRSNSAILDSKKLMEYVNITTNSVHCRLLSNHEMRFSPDQSELLEFNKVSMSIVTPDVGVSTTNPNPNASLQLGVQVNAINFSNADENMKNDMDLFITAGYAFILKPANLRYIPVTIDIPADNPTNYSFKPQEFEGRGFGPWNI